MSDPAIPSTSAVCDNDLTSILNALENNNFVQIQNNNLNEIEHRLEEIIEWLNGTVLKVAISGRKGKSGSFLKKLRQFMELSVMIEYQARKAENPYRMKLKCGVCGVRVLKKKTDFLSGLQKHAHIEELWAKYLAGEAAEFQEINCEAQNETEVIDKTDGVPLLNGFMYDKVVAEGYFPEEIMKFVYLIDSVPEFTIQRVLSGSTLWYSCLLCKSHNILDNTVLQHVQGPEHLSKAANPVERAILTAYHSHFSDLPALYQAHSIYFEPNSIDQTRCWLCDSTIEYSDVKKHILDANHKDAIVTNFHVNSTSVINEICATHADDLSMNIEQETINTATVNETESNTEFPSDKAVRNYLGVESEIKSDDDKPAEFKFNFVIAEDEETKKESSSEELLYDPKVLKIAFPERITTACYEIDNVPYYTVQIINEKEAFCLLCKRPIEARFVALIAHVKGSRHRKNSESDELVISLKAFHTAFMQLPYDYQPHLSYFYPFSDKETHCELCNQRVHYHSLRAHIVTNSHRTNILRLLGGGFFNKDALRKRSANLYFKLARGSVEIESGSSSTDSPVRNGVGKPVKKSASLKNKITHDIVKSVTNPNSTSFFEQLENRFRSHLNLLDERLAQIFCKCCNTGLLKTPYFVKKHVISEEHKSKAGVANKKYKFICEVCNTIYSRETSWQDHLQHELHVKRCSAVPNDRKINLTEYECRTCNIILFGDALCLKKHESLTKKEKKKNKVIVLSEDVKVLFKSEEHINSVATQFVLEANSVVEFQNNVLACCKALETALSQVFPDCHAHPFGSRVSGLGNQNSDLDVFVDIGDMYKGTKNQDPKSQEAIVKTAHKALKKYPGRVFTHVNPVPTARTPIVQVFHTITQLDCDLSFRHGLSIENTKFLRVCISLQPITQHLILILKKWSQYLKLDETITTYALSMMVIFYLQTKGYLLSVKQLKTINSEQPLVIDGWETINYTLSNEAMKSYVKPYPGSLKLLLCEFFKYYYEFKYNIDVVCPLLGHTVPKACFNGGVNGNLLPPEMQSYVMKLTTEKEPELFRSQSPFCIQDPFDLSHNLTKACALKLVTKLQTLCQLSLNYLHNGK